MGKRHVKLGDTVKDVSGFTGVVDGIGEYAGSEERLIRIDPRKTDSNGHLHKFEWIDENRLTVLTETEAQTFAPEDTGGLVKKGL